MAENHQQVYPLAQQENGRERNDPEMASSDAKELKRKKRIKLAIYIAIFAVFQIIVITVFGLVVMRAKSPKVRLGKDDFQFSKLETTPSPSPSFDMSFTAQIRIKNPNFGPYKYENTTVTFTSQGTAVGQVVIAKGKVGIKGTKKVAVSVSLDSKQVTNTANIGSDLGVGILTLSSTAVMRGKAELIWIMKKNKSGEMNCTITINVGPKTIKALECK